MNFPNLHPNPYTNIPDGVDPKSIEESLVFGYGNDFSKYLRSIHGPFPWSPEGMRNVTYRSVMNGRKFKIFMTDDKKKDKNKKEECCVWKTGKVDYWFEQNFGPMDVHIKLDLVVIFDGEDNIECFNVHRMNVNGGGTVRKICDDTLLSLEWIDPFTESHNYYFDVTQRPFGMKKPIDQEKLRSKREQTLKYFNKGEFNFDDLYPKKFHMFWGKIFNSYMALQNERGEKVDNFDMADDVMYNIRMDFLSMPFIPMCDLVWILILEQNYFEENVPSRKWKNRLVQIYVECALLLRDDVPWMEQTKKLYSDTGSSSGEGLTLNDWYNTTYHNLIINCAEYYESKMEYRAAIWTYKMNLRSLYDPKYTIKCVPIKTARYSVDGLTMKESCLLANLSFIALAYERLGNNRLAFKYYRESISMTTKSNDSQNFVIKAGNNKSFKRDVQEWVGTTGSLTPWSLNESSDAINDGENDGIPAMNKKQCFVCKKEPSNLLACSACSSLTWYCSRDCQQNDWKRHKLICFRRPRNKPKPTKNINDYYLI